MHGRGKNIFNDFIRFLSRNVAFFQLFSVECMLCTAQGTDSFAKGSTDYREREMEKYEAAASAAWSSVCLCSLISADPVTGNIVLLKTRIL